MPLSEDFTEDLKEAFEIYDKEKAGKLDKDTLGVVLRSLGQNPTEGERPKLFRSHPNFLQLRARERERVIGATPVRLHAAELTEIFGAVAGVADQKVDVDGMLKAAQMMADKMGSGDHGAALLEVRAHRPRHCRARLPCGHGSP